MGDTEFIGFTGPSVFLVEGEAGSVDGSPDGFPCLGVVQLERELRLSRDHPDTDTTPDHLRKQECSVGQD